MITAHAAWEADPRSRVLDYPAWCAVLGEEGIDAARSQQAGRPGVEEAPGCG